MPTEPKGRVMTDNILNYNDFIKSAKRDGIFSHPDIQQRMLMMMGDKKNQKLELDKKEENQVAKNYQKMYFALATIRWCNGETLGVARQHALEQMNTYVKTKSNIAHPMNKYLIGINGQINREVSYHNMTDEHANEKIDMNSTLAKKWAAESTQIFQENMRELNTLYQKYMPQNDKKQQPAAIKFELVNRHMQKMLQQMMIQQQTNQRAA